MFVPVSAACVSTVVTVSLDDLIRVLERHISLCLIFSKKSHRFSGTQFIQYQLTTCFGPMGHHQVGQNGRLSTQIRTEIRSHLLTIIYIYIRVCVCVCVRD